MDVSIIIPAYNRLWCLPKAVESCRNTACKTEIIVVDDGSTDGTWEWLSKQQYLIAVKQENQGQVYAINKGFTLAKGKYIRFLDSDDFLCEGIIDKQYQKAVETNAQLVCSRVDGYDEGSGSISINPDIINWQDFLEVQLGNGYGSHFLGMQFDRILIEKTPRRPDFAFREDRMFLLEIGLLFPKMEIVDGCAGYWVKHKSQMQGNYIGFKSQVVNWQHLNIYKKILGELSARQKLTTSYKNAACTVLWPLAHWIAIKHLPEAKELVKWIYKLNPHFKNPETGILGIVYKKLGFTLTERLLRIRRKLLLR